MTAWALILMLSFNISVFIIFCVMFYRWISAMNTHVEDVYQYIEYVEIRTRGIYINQLLKLRDTLSQEERYEDAERLQEVIDKEIQMLKEDGEDDKVDLY